jgi:superfamily I DNA/RNA helicase
MRRDSRPPTGRSPRIAEYRRRRAARSTSKSGTVRLQLDGDRGENAARYILSSQPSIKVEHCARSRPESDDKAATVFHYPVELGLKAKYEPHLDRIHEDAETRRADLLQLEQIASGYPSRERFLTELTLDPPDATSDQAGVPLLDEDYVILSTIHSAKGQEWKSVYLLNVVDVQAV